MEAEGGTDLSDSSHEMQSESGSRLSRSTSSRGIESILLCTYRRGGGKGSNVSSGRPPSMEGKNGGGGAERT